MEPTSFYYSDGKSQFGPFSREEMKSKPITNDTLVWFEGLPSWKRAGEVVEMREFLEPVQPPVSHPDFQPVSQPDFQPVQMSDFQPVQQPEYNPVQQQPVRQTVRQPVSQARPRKDFTRLLFIFSLAGIFLGLLMMACSIGVAMRLSLPWGLFFFVCSHLFVFISVLATLKMGKELNVEWKKFL